MWTIFTAFPPFSTLVASLVKLQLDWNLQAISASDILPCLGPSGSPMSISARMENMLPWRKKRRKVSHRPEKHDSGNASNPCSGRSAGIEEDSSANIKADQGSLQLHRTSRADPPPQHSLNPTGHAVWQSDAAEQHAAEEVTRGGAADEGWVVGMHLSR